MRVQVAMPGKSIVLGLDGVEELDKVVHALETAHLDPESLGKLPFDHPDKLALLALAAKMEAVRPVFLSSAEPQSLREILGGKDQGPPERKGEDRAT